MEIRIENGETAFVPAPPLSQTEKKEILNRVVQKYRPEGAQFVPFPIFCFSCQQQTVEFKDQCCPACVAKITNREKNRISISLPPSLLLGLFILFGTVIFIFLKAFRLI